MTEYEYRNRSRAVVELDSIVHNMRTIQKTLPPGCRFMAVVKADAYGHGDKYIPRLLEEAGADFFGVSNLDEGISLRANGVSRPILIFGATPPSRVAALQEHRLTQTVYSAFYAGELHAAAEAAGLPLSIHIKIDTGMSRLGFPAHEADLKRSAGEIKSVCSLPRFRAEGIYTHFAAADEPESDAFTRRQFSLFQSLLDALAAEGVRIPLRHCCNSAGTMRFPAMHMNMVRVGIALYGLLPGPVCDGILPLEPAMSLYSAVSMVKEVPAGTPVSYGRTFTTTRPTKIATIPIGYADGYSRVLSGKARMLIRGQYAPVIGRVCMDQLMLDVTDLGEITPGDLVTIVGEDGGHLLTFDEMAALSGTIHYEKTCQLSKRIPRIYRSKGSVIGVADCVRDLCRR